MVSEVLLTQPEYVKKLGNKIVKAFKCFGFPNSDLWEILIDF